MTFINSVQSYKAKSDQHQSTLLSEAPRLGLTPAQCIDRLHDLMSLDAGVTRPWTSYLLSRLLPSGEDFGECAVKLFTSGTLS